MQKSAIAWNVNQLAKAKTNGSLCFDNAIQRSFVWDKAQMSLLIDTILRGYVVPPVYTIKTNEKVQTKKGSVSVYDCIDGKQRCTTLAMYLNDEFALEGLESFNYGEEEVDINGLKFSELDEDMQNTIKSYTITVYFFTDITDDEVTELMSRLNNGRVLTGIEKARIKAIDLKRVQALANHPLLTENLTTKAIAGYANEDIVMKVLLQMNGDSNLSSKNVQFAYENYNLSENAGKEKAEKLSKALDFVKASLNVLTTRIENKEIKAKIAKKVVGKTNLISIIYLATKLNDTVTAEQYADFLTYFFDSKKISVNSEYNDACSNGTMRCANVEARNNAIESALSEKTN